MQSNGTELLKKVKVVMGKSVNPYDEMRPELQRTSFGRSLENSRTLKFTTHGFEEE